MSKTSVQRYCIIIITFKTNRHFTFRASPNTDYRGKDAYKVLSNLYYRKQMSGLEIVHHHHHHQKKRH